LYVSGGIERLIQEKPCNMCRSEKEAISGKTDLACKDYALLLLVVVVVVVPHYITINPENIS